MMECFPPWVYCPVYRSGNESGQSSLINPVLARSSTNLDSREELAWISSGLKSEAKPVLPVCRETFLGSVLERREIGI